MKSAWIFLLLICCGQISLAQGIPAIGQWRDHLPMRNVLSLAVDESTIVAGTAFGYFAYKPETKEIFTQTKSNGLSQVDLRLLSKHPNSDVFILAYQNADIDLVKGDQIKNLPDLLKSSIQEDKTINHINWVGDDAYLSTHLGIVVVNTQREEIKNTFRFGQNGTSIKVYQTALLSGVLYAATEKGLYSAQLSSPSLNDFRSWTAINVFGSSHAIQRVLNWNNQLVLQRNDSLFINKNGEWSFLYANQKLITTLELVNKQLLIGQTDQGKGSISLIDPVTLNVNVTNSSYLTLPKAAVFLNGTIWVGDETNGLINISDANEMPVFPETPAGLANGEGVYINQEILIAAGRLNDQTLQFAFKEGFYSFKNDSWNSFNSTNSSAIDSLRGVVGITNVPVTGSVFAGADNGGLLEITKDNIAILYKQNSFLSPVFNDPLRFSIGGLVTDRDQQLWLTNNGAPQGLIVRKKDGAVQKFTVPFSYTNFGLSKLIVDDQNRKWIVAANADGLFCFDHGISIENIADDRWRHFKQGLGRGNLPSNKVTSIAVDRNGFIWVGTDKGIALIQCGDDLFSSGTCEAVLPVVQQDNFAGRLLAEEQINDIEVDGADRKWIATNNGVWLLSADGQQVIHRFTAFNSKLLNNVVSSIVIHQGTGEVFFMTQKGICSYRGSAIAPVEVMKKPFVFPNPVPPGFSGTIAIRDLPENAWVSITELDGRVVYKTRSLGGQAIWNGKNYKGERMSSGTYLIIVSNEFNTQQVAGKIFFLK